jgi:hypothetical protein
MMMHGPSADRPAQVSLPAPILAASSLSPRRQLDRQLSDVAPSKAVVGGSIQRGLRLSGSSSPTLRGESAGRSRIQRPGMLGGGLLLLVQADS